MDKRKKQKCTACGKIKKPQHYPVGAFGAERPYCSFKCMARHYFPGKSDVERSGQ